jgi:hypothetical protein
LTALPTHSSSKKIEIAAMAMVAAVDDVIVVYLVKGL